VCLRNASIRSGVPALKLPHRIARLRELWPLTLGARTTESAPPSEICCRSHGTSSMRDASTDRHAAARPQPPLQLGRDQRIQSPKNHVDHRARFIETRT
jgi:hypothetical protein